MTRGKRTTVTTRLWRRQLDWGKNVEEHGLTRWQTVRLRVGGVVMLAAVVAQAFVPTGSVPRMLLGVIEGYYAGRGVLVYRWRHAAYQRGYLAGRLSWWASMSEAQDRGIRPWDWVRAEFERDFHDLLP